LEAAFGLVKRLINRFNKQRYDGVAGLLNTDEPTQKEKSWHDDRRAKLFPYAFALSRTAVIVLTTVLLIGFLVTLPIPIPGITTLAGLGALAIAKVCTIAICYTTAAKALGGFCGALYDTYKTRKIWEGPEKKEITKSELIFGITAYFVFSEFYTALSSFVKRCRQSKFDGSGGSNHFTATTSITNTSITNTSITNTSITNTSITSSNSIMNRKLGGHASSKNNPSQDFSEKNVKYQTSSSNSKNSPKSKVTQKSTAEISNYRPVVIF
jgi:hypothetical protein